MDETKDAHTNFAATYFDRDFVIRLSRWAGIAGWIILAAYAISWLVSFTQFLFQFNSGIYFQKGMTIVDAFNFFTPFIMQPLPGIVFFIVLQAVGQALLILMDMEDNLRRAARNAK